MDIFQRYLCKVYCGDGENRKQGTYHGGHEDYQLAYPIMGYYHCTTCPDCRSSLRVYDDEEFQAHAGMASGTPRQTIRTETEGGDITLHEWLRRNAVQPREGQRLRVYWADGKWYMGRVLSVTEGHGFSDLAVVTYDDDDEEHLNLIQEYWEEVLDDNTPIQHLRNPTPPSQASPEEPERQAATIKSEDCSLGFIDTERVQQPAAAHVRPESGAGSSRKRTSKLAEQIIGIEEERDEMKKQLENERTACADLRRQLEEAKSAALALKSERDALKGELHATNAELKEQRRTTDVNLEASVREATMLRNENVALQLRCGEAEAAVRKIEAQQQEINALTRRIQRATEGLAPSNLPNQSDDDDSVNRQD